MRFGFGPSSAEMFALLGYAGENTVETARAVERRFREYPSSGVTQDDIKEFEHQGDRIVSQLLRCINDQFITPYDRRPRDAAFAVDEVPDKIENASEMLGLYGVQSTTRQSIELCGLLVRATVELAALPAG